MIVLNNSTQQIAFTGFTQQSKDWIFTYLSDLTNPVFLYHMRIIYPNNTIASTYSEYNYGGLDSQSEGEEWRFQKDILWYNSANESFTDKYILLNLSLGQDNFGPTFSPSVNMEDGQYTFQLRMIPIGEGVIEQLTGITSSTTDFPNGPTMSFSNLAPYGWTQSWSDKREIVDNSYLLQVGRLLVINDPILTKEVKPLGYDNGVYVRKDDDDDVYL
jgi:hypothetical protein